MKNSMKRTKKIVIRTLAFCLIFALLFIGSSTFLQVACKISVASVQGFYKEPENSLDVVVIGASEVYSGYCAPLAWQEYGYTSYSLSVSGVPGSLYKSMAREALASQNPKLMVFEINGFLQDDDYFERTAQLHYWIDQIRDEDNKKETIAEAVPEDQKEGFENTFALNHGNWKMMDCCFDTAYARFKISHEKQSCLKGFASKAMFSDSKSSSKGKELYFTEKSRAYLTGLLEYCKSQGMENVLFARFPHQKNVKNPEVLEEIQQLVESYGYDFENFEDDREQLDLLKAENYYNPEHLNVVGSRKFTKYFGQYLVDHYQIVGEHTEEVKSNWDDCAQQAEVLLQKLEKDTQKRKGKFMYEGSK
ncbi:MAG: hypothetical protein E7282_07160 [Lachnospiraceae bacterium]|jgi:hypothetical protein|nr:hypothetical protein [Lachnospiraceae bacterium]